jgi:hypothetical protein
METKGDEGSRNIAQDKRHLCIGERGTEREREREGLMKIFFTWTSDTA